MKRFLKICALLCTVSFVAGMLCSCSKTLTADDAYNSLRTAVNASLEYKTYYIQEMITHNKLLDKTTVNLRCELDEDYAPVTENGRYLDYKAEIHKTESDLPVADIFCGTSKSSSGEKRDALFYAKYENLNGESNVLSKTVSNTSIENFIASDEFKNHYSIDYFLRELKNMKAEDFDFSGNEGKTRVKNNLTLLSFRVTDDYLEKYKSENKSNSVFDGSTRVEIEIIYGRIASVVTFCSYKDATFNQSFEESPYKLFITYYGPKFDLPQFDAKTDKGQPEWIEIKV